jgi:hypothetical protein
MMWRRSALDMEAQREISAMERPHPQQSPEALSI